MISESPIILFDGVCNLCNGSVLFILKYEKNKDIKFATLQSEVAKKLLSPFKGVKISDSVLLIEKGNLYQKSTAALRIARKLRYFWFFYFIIYFPQWMRDPIYKWIAANRYKWFGKKEYCMVPDENLKARFL